MTPPPVAVGLILCEQVIIDLHTRNPTPIKIFSGLVVESFPSEIKSFSAFAALTNGRGNGTIRLVATRLDNGAIIYEQRCPIQFPVRWLLRTSTFVSGPFDSPCRADT